MNTETQPDIIADRNARNRLQIAIAIAYSLLPLLSSSVTVALPKIGKEFSLDAIMLTWVSTAFLIPSVAFLLPFSRIADVIGKKKFFILGVIVFNITCILCAMPRTELMLIIFRALQGAGGALCWSTGTGIIASAFPANERGKALGINAASVYLGLTIGPLVGGFLTQHFGWRSIFWLSLVRGLISLGLLLRLKGEWIEARRGKFDLIGSIIIALAVTALMYGFSQLPAANGAIILAAGVLGIAAFIWWESRVKNPLLNLTLFTRNRVFAFSNSAALASYSATIGISFLASLYLQYAQGFSPQKAGLVLMTMPVVQAAISPLAGRLSDKVVPQQLATAGMLLTTIGLVMLAFLRSATSLWFIIASLVIVGAGFAFFSSPNTNAVLGSVEKKHYNISSAMLAMMRQMGMMLSMGIIMVLFAVLIGRVEITAQYVVPFITSTRIAFTIFAVICFAGSFASLAGYRNAAQSRKNLS